MKKKQVAGKKKRRTYVTMSIDSEYYENVMKPLLSFFALGDDVFTEDDALSDPAKAKIGLGRLYEEWKRCRKRMDPGFTHDPAERPQKWLPKQVRMAKKEGTTSRRVRGSRISSTETS